MLHLHMHFHIIFEIVHAHTYAITSVKKTKMQHCTCVQAQACAQPKLCEEKSHNICVQLASITNCIVIKYFDDIVRKSKRPAGDMADSLVLHNAVDG